MKIFNLYFLIISFISFSLMYLDKKRAISKKWRIPESTFFTLSLIGGALGTYLGMYKFRHKTKHIKFIIGIPLCMLFNIILYYMIYLFN